MARYAYVYVGTDAARNFDIGMAKRVWGWKHPRYGPLGNEAVDWLTNPSHATYLAFVQNVTPAAPVRGWPRTPEIGPWLTASYGSVTLARLARTLYVSTDAVWPDATYEYRIDLDSITPVGSFPGAQLHPDVVRAIRDSAVRRGVPILGPEPLTDAPRTDADIVSMLRKGSSSSVAAVLDGAATGVSDSGGDLPDRLLAGLDNLDGFALAVVRTEQRALRRYRFGTSTEISCALCGRVLPVGLVRLAHIKRRAEADRDERLLPANTMPACTLGCDELFERGYVVVDPSGVVTLNPAMRSTGDLVEAIRPLVGRRVHGYSAEQERFFASHRGRHKA